MQYDIFFSYSRSSVDMAKRIINQLEKCGLIIWFDQYDVILGCDIKKNLDITLNSLSKWIGVILLIDAEYLYKDWCITELDYAVLNNIPIFPLLYKYEKVELPSRYEFLKKLNIATIRDPSDLCYAYNKILGAIINTINITALSFDNENYIFQEFIRNYNCLPHNSFEKVVLADNIAHYIEIVMDNNIDHNNQILLNIIHNKIEGFYHTSNIESYDIKIVCAAMERLLYRQNDFVDNFDDNIR